MNIKLSVYAHRVCGKSGFVICMGGKNLDLKVSSIRSSNIKEEVLTCLADGLRHCRSYVSHNDILYIEIQNQHLCNWLTGRVEYKAYCTYLDEVFDALESLDCRYRFVHTKNPGMKNLIKSNDVSVGSFGQSLADVMAEFDE